MNRNETTKTKRRRAWLRYRYDKLRTEKDFHAFTEVNGIYVFFDLMWPGMYGNGMAGLCLFLISKEVLFKNVCRLQVKTAINLFEFMYVCVGVGDSYSNEHMQRRLCMLKTSQVATGQKF